jgi:hypothetical protein
VAGFLESGPEKGSLKVTGVTIVPVSNAAEMNRFIRLPSRLFAADPNFVTPLEMERRDALDFSKNPFFEHAEAQYFLAVRDGRDVGRISAQVDKLIKEPSIGQFGLIVAEDDAEVFRALFAAAEDWLRKRGRTRIQGPFNLTINEETGLLVDGFTTPPMIFMSHDPKYAGARIEAQGYAKAKDVIAYLYDMTNGLPRTISRMLERHKPVGMTVRNIDMKNYDREFDTVINIFNDAWSQNWGFVPFTEAELKHTAKGLKPLLDSRLTSIVEMNGVPIGFGIMLPNLNEIISDFKGRLLPFNWIKLLTRLKRARTSRVPLMGVRRSFNGGLATGLVPILLIETMRQGALKRGIQHVELSWILEDNKPMRRIIESLGSDAYKTYRVYEKVLQ